MANEMNKDNITLFIVFRITLFRVALFYCKIVKATNTRYTNELKSKYENKRHILSRYFKQYGFH